MDAPVDDVYVNHCLCVIIGLYALAFCAYAYIEYFCVVRNQESDGAKQRDVLLWQGNVWGSEGVEDEKEVDSDGGLGDVVLVVCVFMFHGLWIWAISLPSYMILKYQWGKTMCEKSEAVSEWRNRMISVFSTNDVNQVLDTASHHPEFRDWLMGQIRGNLECCSSRTKMGFNEIYTKWKLVTAVDKPWEEKVEVVKAAARTYALRTAVSRRVKTFESVEVYLYYEHTLKDVLGLLTASTSSNSLMGDRIRPDVLISTTLDSWERYLLEILDAHDQLFPDYPTSVPQVQLDAMQSQREAFDQLFEAKKITLVEYEGKMKKLQRQFDGVLFECKQNWINTHIHCQ